MWKSRKRPRSSACASLNSCLCTKRSDSCKSSQLTKSIRTISLLTSCFSPRNVSPQFPIRTICQNTNRVFPQHPTAITVACGKRCSKNIWGRRTNFMTSSSTSYSCLCSQKRYEARRSCGNFHRCWWSPTYPPQTDVVVNFPFHLHRIMVMALFWTEYKESKTVQTRFTLEDLERH